VKKVIIRKQRLWRKGSKGSQGGAVMTRVRIGGAGGRRTVRPSHMQQSAENSSVFRSSDVPWK